MKNSRSIFAVLSIVVTTLLSLGIGGFATYQSSKSDIKAIDTKLAAVVQNVLKYSNESTSSALYIIESEKFDISLSLLSSDGQVTSIVDSHLEVFDIPNQNLIDRAQRNPITVRGEYPYRFRVIETPSGDKLLLGASLKDADRNLRDNLANVALFTLFANAIAILLSILLLRSNNRGLDRQALERMQEFLADASHELRTPLTVIKGYTEMLSKEQFKESADRDRAFSRVNSEIKRMENLIHDLLLLAELGESKQIEFHRTDVTELVQGLLNDFQTLHPTRVINSSLEANIEIECVREHLHRLVLNVLANIEKHTPADAPVRVSLRAKSKSLILVIEDGGPGLPESAYKSEIKAMTRFDPSRSRSSGGSGLGLSIIAAIVQEHDGKLSLSKSDLGGLRVQIELAL